MCVRTGGLLSEFRPILTGVPQGAVLSPLLFNLMLKDFSSPPANVKKILYAVDVTIYTTVSLPIAAEDILQPVLEKISEWGRQWNFTFSGEKSAQLVFTRSNKPRADPLLLIRGQRIRSVPHIDSLV